MTRAGPALVVRFLATDPALSVGTLEVWAEAAFRAKATFDEVTIAVVDTTADPLDDVRIEDLRLACQTSSVRFLHLCAAPGARFGDVAAQLCGTADDVLLVADPGDVPSPWLLERMLQQLAAPGVAVADAQPLPMAAREEPHGEDCAEVPAGVCVLLSGAACTQLGGFEISSTDADIGRLLAAAEHTGLGVAGDRRATVFRDRRVTSGDRLSAGAAVAGSRPSADRPDPEVASHPATLPATSLAEVLRATGVQPPFGAGPEPASCFLTVLTRTQGRRPFCLEELLLCLAAQTVRDFEVVVACHRASADDVRATTETVAACPAWLRARVRVIEVDRPGRAAPLNDALDVAHGRYAVVLDDDDLVLAHWVETFAELERRSPGRMLRAVALRQDVTPAVVAGQLSALAVGAPRADWPLTFELVDHLNANATPGLSMAFPRGVYADLGLRFDEQMLAIEDWEYLVRAAGLVGVEASPEPTCIYRWWLDGDSSRTAQTPEDWVRARSRAHDALDSRVVLLPRGSAGRIRSLFDDNRRAWAQVRKSDDAHEATAARLTAELAEAVTDHEQALGRALDRAEVAEARVVALQKRLRRQWRRTAHLQEALDAAADRPAPEPGLLRRLAGRAVSRPPGHAG